MSYREDNNYRPTSLYQEENNYGIPWEHGKHRPPFSRCQTHNHEILGSVRIAQECKDPHNHRFAAVSGEAIPCGPCDHVHEVKFRTDFYEDHYHEFCCRTGGAIRVGDRHVHFLRSATNFVDGHRHKFRVATLIEDPIGD